jgi:hypothetical protein
VIRLVRAGFRLLLGVGRGILHRAGEMAAAAAGKHWSEWLIDAGLTAACVYYMPYVSAGFMASMVVDQSWHPVLAGALAIAIFLGSAVLLFTCPWVGVLGVFLPVSHLTKHVRERYVDALWEIDIKDIQQAA